MCGIAGILNFSGEPVRFDDIRGITDALAHRGRDSANIVLGGNSKDKFSTYPGIALGHRRLSIIDLSGQSAQPMLSRDGQLCIVYNGELYNYRELRRELGLAGYHFATDSDTEVVLMAFEAWGEDCLSRFNGMFAFAIWSERTQSLFCARDPLGIKPFYYALDKDSFSFASESQALRNPLFGLNADAVTCYFLSMYIPRHLSIFSGISKLLPGHCMRVERSGEVSQRCYWKMPKAGFRHPSINDAAMALQECLDRAVAMQLRSDVPVGALLSGGFDSGMIVASASRTGTALHTYSVGFDDGLQFDELPIARSLAERYSTQHHERIIQASEVMELLDSAIARMSEPVADSAIVPTYCLSQMAASDGVKVLLSGTGGDEVFAGYSRYVASSSRRKMFNRIPPLLKRALGKTVLSNTLLGARMMYPSLDMLFYTGGSAGLTRNFFENNSAFHGFLSGLAQQIFPNSQDGVDSLYQNMQFDLQVYLPDLLLMLLDQITMAHTVEGRVPLLDVDLLAASYSLASHYHASPSHPETRRLMRVMADKQLDSRTFTAKKQGFSGPIKSWIMNNRQRFMDRVMEARAIPLLSTFPVDALWRDGAQQQNPFWATEVFSLYCFTTWYQAHAR